MSVTVNQLNNDHFDQLINTCIKEQLDIIDKKIIKLPKQLGVNSLVIDLPINFSNIPFDKTVITIIVHKKIIDSLESRGFVVKLVRNNNSTINAIITWKTSIYSDFDIQNAIAFLKSKEC